MTNEQTKVVLIVEDEKFMRDVLQLHLRDHGFKILEAENGAEALQTVRRQTVDLVIADIHMPVMNGVELLKEVRELNPALPPFVFTTSFSDISSEEALDLGAEAFLRKPLHKKELLEIVEKALVPKHKRWTQGAILSESARRFDFTVDGDHYCRTPGGVVEDVEIGQGGMFLPVANDFPRSFEVIKFKVDSGRVELGVLEGVGQVRWVRQEWSPGLMMGIGVEFLELEAQARAKLLKYLDVIQPKQYIPIGKDVGPTVGLRPFACP